MSDLESLGLLAGDTVIAHVSFRAVGRLLGGPATLMEALMKVVGPRGTVIAPSFTTYLADPGMWRQPPPESEWDRIRRETPPFDPYRHPAQRSLGIFPELLRASGVATRSRHPLYSFVANGQLASWLCSDHPLDFALGSQGPLQRFHDANGRFLLVGVGWQRCTLLHLSEHHVAYRGRRGFEAAVPAQTSEAGTRWITTNQLVLHEGDFPEIGRRIEGSCRPRSLTAKGRIGLAEAVLGSSRDVALEASRLLMRYRDLSKATLSEPYPRLRLEGVGRL